MRSRTRRVSRVPYKYNSVGYSTSSLFCLLPVSRTRGRHCFGENLTLLLVVLEAGDAFCLSLRSGPRRGVVAVLQTDRQRVSK